MTIITFVAGASGIRQRRFISFEAVEEFLPEIAVLEQILLGQRGQGFQCVVLRLRRQRTGEIEHGAILLVS